MWLNYFKAWLFVALFVSGHSLAHAETLEQAEKYLDAGSYEKAYRILTNISDKNAVANFHLGRLYYQGNGVLKNKDTSFDFFIKSAEGGFPTAQLILSLSYRDGDGVDEDLKRSAWWLREAAVNGNLDAQYILGFYQSNVFASDAGEVPYSEREALRWLSMAANSGHLNAMAELSKLFSRGNIKNNEKSEYWLVKAAEGGHEESITTLSKND